MVRLNFDSLKMDLIREYYQSDEEVEEIEIIEDQNREPEPVAFENLTRREQKELFKEIINPYPVIDTERYTCNWCPSTLTKGSVIRHVRQSHPEHLGPHWRNLCRRSTKSLQPVLKDLTTELTEERRIKVFAHVSWGGSRKKRHLLADVIGSHSIRTGLNQFRESGARRLRMLTLSDEVTQMYDLWRAVKDQAGRYGLAMPPTLDDECAICLNKGPNTNKSVYFHWDNPDNQHHRFCTDCIQLNISLGNTNCPLCNEPGYPIRLHHLK